MVPPSSNGWSFPKRPPPADHGEDITTPGLHAPELARGLVRPDGAAGGGSDGVVGMGGKGGDGAESGKGGTRRGKYVMGDDGSLTDDEEGGGGWMDDS